MSKLQFVECKTSQYTVDPIFKASEFKLYRDFETCCGPEIFVVEDYRFWLLDPENIVRNEALCHKLATYLYFHPTHINQKEVAYLIGDINECKEIAKEWTNRIAKIVSIDMIEAWYPKTIDEINKLVVNFFITKQRYYGEMFNYNKYNQELLFFCPFNLKDNEKMTHVEFIIEQLYRKGLFKRVSSNPHDTYFTLTEDAINQYQITEVTSNKNNRCFIAIKFRDNEQRIQVIQDAIAECGYEPIIMTEYQTNDWIMPEIFHQIKLSKFVVVDLSLRCDGAYYESGYAYALGKEVIHLFDEREKDNNPLHFDVAQKSTVIYENFDDLKIKLMNRIKATISK